ncbi:MAG TPA: pentapeptide repeat-containing protein [Pyrinomonadaceae bacterium]
MSSSPTTKAPTGSTFVCDCKEDFRSACKGEPFYKEYKGKRYCLLHYPGKEKSKEFDESLKRKFSKNNFDFSGVWFPDKVQFQSFQFDVEVSFRGATFNAAADFSEAKFDADVNFNHAEFNEKADFNYAVFKAEAYFRKAFFNNAEAAFREVKFGADVYFTRAVFGAKADFYSANFIALAYFRYASFSEEVNLRNASFRGPVRFGGKSRDERISLDLQYAEIEKPAYVSFQKLTLRPHLFVNVDARKFEFTRVDWDWRSIDKEIGSLKSKDVSSPHDVLAVACWYLADNAEENHRYEEASKFRYMAMDARRREKWRGFAPWRLSWWYWLASGYGERVLRAFVVLIGVWFLFALLYTQVGFARWEPRRTNEREAVTESRDEVGEPLGLPRALTYSLGVMTFQKPEPRPATTAAQSFVILETILGPLQAALLALAIRRKFMR